MNNVYNCTYICGYNCIHSDNIVAGLHLVNIDETIVCDCEGSYCMNHSVHSAEIKTNHVNKRHRNMDLLCKSTIHLLCTKIVL